ncbi:MAG: ABC transporter substrate-binding protein [candidate division Zixibacteria bacterium]|nr:ABC transporter substrate-binding protein [candidate division Zixibacteria bacterium]
MSKKGLGSVLILISTFLCYSVGLCLLVSCSGESIIKTRKHIILKIDWTPEPTYFGIFYAKEKGFYKEAGFDVEIIYGKGAPIVAGEISLGAVKVGTTTSDNILTQVAQGRKYSLCVPLLKFNPFAILSLANKPVRSLDDLKGKKIGVNVESITYTQYLTALRNANIDKSEISEVPVGWGGAEFLVAGKVDAILGYITNHGVDLQAKGKDYVSILYSNLNIPLYSYGLVLAFAPIDSTSEDYLTECEMFHFAKATMEGYEKGAASKIDAAKVLAGIEPSLNEDRIIYGIDKITRLNAESKANLENIDLWKQDISERNRQLAKSYYRYDALAAKCR